MTLSWDVLWHPSTLLLWLMEEFSSRFIYIIVGPFFFFLVIFCMSNQLIISTPFHRFLYKKVIAVSFFLSFSLIILMMIEKKMSVHRRVTRRQSRISYHQQQKQNAIWQHFRCVQFECVSYRRFFCLLRLFPSSMKRRRHDSTLLQCSNDLLRYCSQISSSKRREESRWLYHSTLINLWREWSSFEHQWTWDKIQIECVSIQSNDSTPIASFPLHKLNFSQISSSHQNRKLTLSITSSFKEQREREREQEAITSPFNRTDRLFIKISSVHLAAVVSFIYSINFSLYVFVRKNKTWTGFLF